MIQRIEGETNVGIQSGYRNPYEIKNVIHEITAVTNTKASLTNEF